jgi:Flp pilus assembly protein RcpC/CpaB
MAMRRSTQMLLIGLAVFVIGVGVVLVSITGSKGDKGGGASATTTTTLVQAGTVVIPAAAPAGPTSFTIPDGKQAVAVQMPYVAGLAGYARAGDTVNIYATLEKGTVGDVPPPSARLVLPSVEVLAVTGPGPGAEAGTGNAVYLLALDAAQAEQAIFFSRFESLWMTLVPKGQPKAQTTGRSYKNAF